MHGGCSEGSSGAGCPQCGADAEAVYSNQFARRCIVRVASACVQDACAVARGVAGAQAGSCSSRRVGVADAAQPSRDPRACGGRKSNPTVVVLVLAAVTGTGPQLVLELARRIHDSNGSSGVDGEVTVVAVDDDYGSVRGANCCMSMMLPGAYIHRVCAAV